MASFNDNTLPGDPREVCRAICIQRGSVPGLEVKAKVWVWHAGHWTKAVVKRRLPGGIYWVECVYYPFNGQGTTCSANTFGGVAEDAK